VLDRYELLVAAGDDFILCPVVHFEVTRNLKLKKSAGMLRHYLLLTREWRPISLDVVDWETAADLWAKRHSIGKAIADADLLIAVCALKSGAILVTNNIRHFEDLGLTLENWNKPL
jgi:predicted nucleic acid-binding protein